MGKNNEYFDNDDRERLARLLMLSRAESGVSQEKVALELGVAKKTVQNWEKGVSAPTLPQAIEWFRVIHVAPMPYFLQFIFPDLEGIQPHNSDEKLRKELNTLINDMPMEGVRQLIYLYYGDHGSSPRGIMNMLTAHLQTPMRDRYNHARDILDDYEIAKSKGNLVAENHIQPDVELLRRAIDEGREAVLEDINNYQLS